MNNGREFNQTGSLRMYRAARLLLLAPLFLPHVNASAQQVNDDAYARDLMGYVVKNPFGLCWRTYSWTAEKAIAECDPDLAKKPVPVAAPRAAAPAPPPAPAAAAPAVAAPVAAPAAPPVAAVVTPPPPQRRTVSLTLGADATFDSGKSELKPEGRAKLDDMAVKLKEPGVNVESMTITGHTDSVGKPDSNRRLSERRAEAVKTYLVGKGINGSLIKTVGRGQSQPVADNKTAQGRAQNRRVEVEITGARAVQ